MSKTSAFGFGVHPLGCPARAATQYMRSARTVPRLMLFVKQFLHNSLHLLGKQRGSRNNVAVQSDNFPLQTFALLPLNRPLRQFFPLSAAGRPRCSERTIIHRKLTRGGPGKPSRKRRHRFLTCQRCTAGGQPSPRQNPSRFATGNPAVNPSHSILDISPQNPHPAYTRR